MWKIVITRAIKPQKWAGKARGLISKIAGIAVLLVGALLAATLCFGAPADPGQDSQHLQAAVNTRKLHFSFIAARPGDHGPYFCRCFQLAGIRRHEIPQAC